MGLEALVRALERDAAEALAARRAETEREVARLLREGEADAEADRAQRRQEVAAAHAVSAGERVAVATRAARLQVLEAERAWLAGMREEVEQRLGALGYAEWRAAVPVLVGTALQYAGPGPVTLTCPAVAEDDVWAVAGGRLDTTVRGVDGMPPGLVLRRDDGTLAVPLSLHDRLDVRWPDLQLVVLAQVGSAA